VSGFSYNHGAELYGSCQALDGCRVEYWSLSNEKIAIGTNQSSAVKRTRDRHFIGILFCRTRIKVTINRNFGPFVGDMIGFAIPLKANRGFLIGLRAINVMVFKRQLQTGP